MLAIELVKIAIIGRVVLGTIPPIPVAPFGNEELFFGQLSLLLGTAGGGLRKEITSLIEVIPRAIVFRSADPDIEVGVNPRTGSQRIQGVEVLVPRDGLRHRDRLNSLVILQQVVEAAQEFAPGFGIVLP